MISWECPCAKQQLKRNRIPTKYGWKMQITKKKNGSRRGVEKLYRWCIWQANRFGFNTKTKSYGRMSYCFRQNQPGSLRLKPLKTHSVTRDSVFREISFRNFKLMCWQLLNGLLYSSDWMQFYKYRFCRKTQPWVCNFGCWTIFQFSFTAQKTELQIYGHCDTNKR